MTCLVYSRFKPNFYNRSTEEDLKRGVKRHEMPRSVKKLHLPSLPNAVREYTNGHHHESPPVELEHEHSPTISQTDVEEVWFAGCHCGMSIILRKNH